MNLIIIIVLNRPLSLSQTSLHINIDIEARNNKEKYEGLVSTLDYYKDFFYSKSIKLTTNSYPDHIYNGLGHNRQQLLMFEADLYIDPKVEYIGFVDTVRLNYSMVLLNANFIHTLSMIGLFVCNLYR